MDLTSIHELHEPNNVLDSEIPNDSSTLDISQQEAALLQESNSCKMNTNEYTQQAGKDQKDETSSTGGVVDSRIMAEHSLEKSHKSVDPLSFVPQSAGCDSQVIDNATSVESDTSGLGLYMETPVDATESPGSSQGLAESGNLGQPKKPFECEFDGGCGRSFTTSAHLKYHNRTHTGERPFVCPHEGCGKTFSSSGHVKYHYTTHSGEKLFSCHYPGCDRVFAWPAHLKYHTKTHTGDRAFRCTFDGCDKSFYVLQRLNVHMRVHTGERPFTCTLDNCMKSFTTAGNLKNHQRIHTGERPYQCVFCGRTFTEHSSLRKHKLTHTGEKPHVCEICGKKFSQSGSRNTHRKRHAEKDKSIDQLIVQGDDDELNQGAVPHIELDTSEDQEQVLTSQSLVYPQNVTEQSNPSDQLVLAQPVVAKEVSIETTPVQPMSVIVQSTGDELLTGQSTPSVVSLAETVVAQQAIIQSIMGGGAVIPAVNQTNSSDEFCHVLQPQDMEHMMQNVVNLGQQILTGQIDLGTNHQGGTLTVDMTGLLQQTEHAQQLLAEHQRRLQQQECSRQVDVELVTKEESDEPSLQ